MICDILFAIFIFYYSSKLILHIYNLNLDLKKTWILNLLISFSSAENWLVYRNFPVQNLLIGALGVCTMYFLSDEVKELKFGHLSKSEYIQLLFQIFIFWGPSFIFIMKIIYNNFSKTLKNE